jgi:CheY-like chemotaxis protein
MPAGGTVTISACEVSVDLGHPTNLPPGPYTCISVRDTGHGMDEATLAHVTEPFFTTKGVGKGTGLGLSMVDGLAGQSGADIDLVISDQAMPGMTGTQLASAIKARRPRLPVILATGYAELPLGTDPDIRRLAKPFTQRELADALIDSCRRDMQR